jgi:arylsulfatase
MMEIDWSVGEIMKALNKNGIEKNTLIILTSDNGPWLNYGNHAGSTGGLREGKATTFDGGLRVPCVMWWPGKIATGVICNKLVSGIDILPTLADLCGAPLPERKIDGVSLKNIIDGGLNDTPRKYFLYYFKKNNLEAVRDGRFKLVFQHDSRTYTKYLPGMDGKGGKVFESAHIPMALYDMRRDPGECYDVQEQNPDVIKKLMKIAEEARGDLGDDLTGNPGKNRRPVGK